MASFFPDFGIMWYLEELNKREFMKFKEFLKQEISQSELKQISWTELKRASREDLANLLLKHYKEKKTWNITFKIFQKLNRKDLIEKAEREIAGHPNLYRAHLKSKLTQDSFRAFNISIQDFFSRRFTQNDCDYFENNILPKRTAMKPFMVFLKGVAGIGKTVVLKRYMLAWSEGLEFQNKFSYIFYFCYQDVKQLKTASLADLISREWPSASAPIEEIVSEPEKILFIIDNMETMECDLSKHESELCENFLEKQPVNVLIGSLLRRKMLPESCILISATPETYEKMQDMLLCTDVKIISGFQESNINTYFDSLFQDKNRAQEVFNLVRGNEHLLSLCQAPVLCWMVGTCIKGEIEKGRDPVLICRRITSLYTTNIFNLFLPQNAQYPSRKSQDQLQSLCSLAAEGMWTDTFVFSEEALRRNGIMDPDIPALLDIGMLGKISQSETLYTFLHPSVQEFCAAMFYLLKSHNDHPSQDVKCIETLMLTFLKKLKVQWVYFGCFIFGLLHKLEQEKLNVFFGYQLSRNIKDKLYQCMETINGNEELQEKIDGMKLFSCLFELEDEAFVIQAMNCMEQIHFVASDYSDITTAAYCLKHCSTLKKLSFSTKNLLNEDLDKSYMEKLLTCWNHICSVFIKSKDIQELQMQESNFSESAFQVLNESLKYSRLTLKGLVANNVRLFTGDYLFFELVQNCHLEYLNLSYSFLSHHDVKLLCGILNQAECNMEKVVVAHCKLSPDDCKQFASVLVKSKSLKNLNLAFNNLGQGISSLCKGLCHANCILENLVLANCSLSEQCWNHLSNVLRQNKTLSYLDISYNDLKDEGLKILCEALNLPDCVLNTLRMTYCLITSSGCQDLADVLKNNQNLKWLHVSNNKLEDAGVKLLCDAIKHPNCHLEGLGLEYCEITSASSEDISSAFIQYYRLLTLVMNPRHFSFTRKGKILAWASESVYKQNQRAKVDILMQEPWVYYKQLLEEREEDTSFVPLYKKTLQLTNIPRRCDFFVPP